MTPLQYITLYLQPTLEPVLTSEELDTLIELAKRPDSSGVAPTEPGWSETYDLNWAVSEGWKMKAAKAASDVQYQIGETSEHREQIIANCLKMAGNYAGIVSVPVSRAGLYR